MKKRRIWGLWISLVIGIGIILAGCSGDSDDSAESSATDAEDNIVVLGDVITSSATAEVPCVVSSRFEQGQRIVFRASVENVTTGESITDANVKVILETGEELEMVNGPHGEEQTLLYTVGYNVAEDFPTGVLEYSIVAEVDGKEYVYEPFDVSLSKLTIISAEESGDTDEE